MNKFILTCLCHTALLLLLCLPAHARVSVGLAGYDQHKLDQLGQQMSDHTAANVKIRSFSQQADITNWLLRFQELDAAIVSAGYVGQQPAGTLKSLADIHLQGDNITPLKLVVRNNLDNDLAGKIQKIFLSFADSKDSTSIMQELGFTGITLPGRALRKTVTKPTLKKSLAVVEEPKPPATKKTEPPETKKTERDVSSTAADAKIIELDAEPVAKQKQQPAVKAVISAPKKTSPEPVAEKIQALPVKTEPEAIKPGQSLPAGTSKEKLKEENAAPPLMAQPSDEKSKTSPNRRLMIFAALTLLLALITKLLLVTLRWQRKNRENLEQEETPQINASAKEEKKVPLAPIIAEESESEALIIETGKLGPGKVPALLKHCANLPRPAVLKVDKGFCEKLVYFAGGQVAGGSTHKSAEIITAARWEKIGHLLVKDGIITEDERSQAKAFLEKEPGLRLGEALLKLRLIDLESLRRALSRQAKSTIFSLILFPEGRYQILAGDGSLPPEESVSLGVNDVIREASQHQAEWTAIRKALPNLSLSLNFHPDGRAKLEKVNLSSQQEETLSLVDGKRTINDLCVESNMMDYEVYRLLYLMVKAGVLN